MQQVLDWLNENELRSFPLREGYTAKITTGELSYNLPDDFLLDLQIKTNVSLQEDSTVYLKKLIYSPTVGIIIQFGTSATTIASFSTASENINNFPKYVRTEDGNLAVFGAGVAAFLAFCTANDVSEQEWLFSIPVEPSVCIQFSDAWLGVNSIKGEPAKQTEQLDFSPVLPLVAISSQQLYGDVSFFEGYNFRLAVQDGLIDMEISSNFGLRMNCTTSFIAEEYLDCDKLVSYINGIPPDATGTFRLNAGANITLTSGNALDTSSDSAINTAKQHSLFVGLSFQATDLCAPVNLTPTTI
jgi:hypothetical protein